MITGKLTYIPDALVGRTLGKYEVREIIGRGGMGVVFKVWDTLEERIKAIKMVPPELASSPLAFDDLKREISMASSIVHPNVLKVLSLEAQDGQYFIVMEYIEGESLEQTIARAENRRLKEEDVIRIMKKTAEGIIEAHAKKVIHRDLKPRNIMVSIDGQVKVLDFGISDRMTRSMTELTGSETSGTWPYMAPEQLSNRFGRENQQVDVWSFGVTMYQLLSGEVPFRNREQIIDLNEKPFPLENVSRKATHIVMKCLEKDRQKRYRDMIEVRGDLEGVRLSPVKAAADADEMESVERMPVDGKGFWEWQRITAAAVVIIAFLFLYYSFSRTRDRGPGFDIDATVQRERSLAGQEYAGLIKRAEEDAARGDHTAALSNLERAKGIAATPFVMKRTGEIMARFQRSQIKSDFQQVTEFTGGSASREEKIEKARAFLNTYRNLSAPQDTEILSMLSRVRDDLEHLQVTIISFAQLPEGVVGGYYGLIRRIEIPGLPEGTRALGRIKIWAYITAQGIIGLQAESIDDTALEVTGPAGIETVKQMIIRKLSTLSLPPPRSKDGVSVRVRDWEIVFKVGTFQDKIILLHEG